MSAIVQAEELSRWYGMVMGLNNVTFEIGPGLTGLVGPNGAGKSTLIQIVTGQLQPSSGRLTVFGETPWNNPRLVQRIGYCPEREAVPKELRPLDWLRGLAYLSGMAGAVAHARCETILDKVGLPREHWGKRMGQYSKGMKQRVKLAQGLLHEPDLLVLDEPMNGLDPMGRQEVGHILKELAANGVSILISSHILAELDREEGWLHIRVKDAPAFYERWTGLLLESKVTVQAIRSQSRSLKNIFDKVTT